jgi:ribosomal-protein-alanine N-acetyltransferase
VTTLPLPWPEPEPTYGEVRLRRFTPGDVPMVMDLSTDPYVPMTGSLARDADSDEALRYIDRQHSRLTTGAGYSFCVALRTTGEAVGQAGLWLASLEHGRATAGYAIAPQARGRGRAGQALAALTAFAWSVRGLHRVELYIEPWNEASVRAARSAGYEYEGLLRSHQSIGGRRVDMRLFASTRPARTSPARRGDA